MWDNTMTVMMLEGIRDTVYMTVVSTFFGYILGLPLGIALTLTDNNGLCQNRTIYRILDVIINIYKKCAFFDTADRSNAFDKAYCGEKLRINSDHHTPYTGSRTPHRTHG